MGEGSIHQVDTVVIGGGTIGTACLWHLAKKGKKALLVERNHIGTGNTSKAASLMTQVRTKEALIPLIQETYKNIEAIEALTNESVAKRKVGTIHIAASENTVSGLNEIVEIANNHTIKNREISKEELQERVPWFNTSKVLKANFMEDDSYVDAYVLAKVYARASQMKGAEIWQDTEVLELLKDGQKIIGVKTTKGIVACDNIVDAAGAWANQLSLQVDVAIPMAPVRSIYWITEKKPSTFSENQPMLTIPDAMAYTRPESGALLFGLREENSPHFHPNDLAKEPHAAFLGNPEDQWDIILKQGKAFVSFFPEFENIGIENCITGISTYTPDGYYTFGEVKELQGFYVAAGCAGAGVAGAGGIGRMISEMINDDVLFTDGHPFRVGRFGAIDPMSVTFRQRCADARSKKKDGG